jgi:GT2 family glycosyltransferase
MAGYDKPAIALAMLYHSKHDGVLERVLKSIEQLYYPKSRIHMVLVDNMSTDGAHEVVDAWTQKYGNEYASITHLRLMGNVPHLRNICLKAAMEKECPYIFFVDSDVILVPDTVNRLLDLLRNDDKVFSASLPYFIPPSRDTLFVRARMKYGKGTLAPLERTDKPYQVPSIGMGATMINISLTSIVGPFDEEIPYIEDLNLTRRATNMGFKVLLDPRVQLLHDKRMTTSKWLKTQLKMGRAEAKNMIRTGTWKRELRGLTYWTLLLISIPFSIISLLPLTTLVVLGWIVFATRFKGLGRLVGFPVMALEKITRTLAIFYGLISCIFWR